MIAQILLAHLVGDYLLQSDWMAAEKLKRLWPAVVHGAFYTLPFLLITLDWRALLIIAGTHIVIDRWRLARWMSWAKNWVAPIKVRRGLEAEEGRWVVESYNPTWAECKKNAGYPASKPAYMSVWLMILADNTMHLILNVVAVRWFG